MTDTNDASGVVIILCSCWDSSSKSIDTTVTEMRGTQSTALSFAICDCYCHLRIVICLLPSSFGSLPKYMENSPSSGSNTRSVTHEFPPPPFVNESFIIGVHKGPRLVSVMNQMKSVDLYPDYITNATSAWSQLQWDVTARECPVSRPIDAAPSGQ
jgi:hypothetical protein